jgi:hypothetical protein
MLKIKFIEYQYQNILKPSTTALDKEKAISIQEKYAKLSTQFNNAALKLYNMINQTNIFRNSFYTKKLITPKETSSGFKGQLKDSGDLHKSFDKLYHNYENRIKQIVYDENENIDSANVDLSYGAKYIEELNKEDIISKLSDENKIQYDKINTLYNSLLENTNSWTELKNYENDTGISGLQHMEFYVSTLLIETLLKIQYIIAYYKLKKNKQILQRFGFADLDILNTNIVNLKENLAKINQTINTVSEESTNINSRIETVITRLEYLIIFFNKL